MGTSVSRIANSKFGATLASIALVVGGVYSSAASAQVSKGVNSVVAPLTATAPLAGSSIATSQTGGEAIAKAPQVLIVFVDHKAIESTTTATSVEQALAEARIVVGKNDIVLPKRHGAVPTDGIIHVERVRTWTVNICSRIAPRTVVHHVATMLKTTTHVKRVGSSGLRQTTIRFTSIDGKRAQSQVLARRMIVAPKPRVIARGTASSRKEVAERLNAMAENTLSHTELLAHLAMSMIATAYTAYCDTCSGTGRGATGMLVHRGVVAVDPRVIPLGSRLYIPGYGSAIAGDTGGAIIGRRIDLAFNSYGDAIRFGRRPVTVYVLHR